MMAKEKIRFSIDVLLKALHSRKSRPKQLENIAENQIIRAIIAQLRSPKLEKTVVRVTERRLFALLDSDRLNHLGKRRALAYFVWRKKHKKLKKSLGRKVHEFCLKHHKADWVKDVLKNS